MRGLKGLIFDCDGVLFESRQANLAYYSAVLDHFGEPAVTADDHEKALLCHTAASPQVFAELLGEDRAAAALAFAATLSYRQFIPWMFPEPDLEEVLTELAFSYPLAVATNRGTSMSEILAHFGLQRHFQAVVTSRDVPRPKPHPDMLLEAARRLALEPADLLFVGDSELDREAAQRAGIRFVAYKGREGDEMVVSGHRELLQRVRGIKPGI